MPDQPTDTRPSWAFQECSVAIDTVLDPSIGGLAVRWEASLFASDDDGGDTINELAAATLWQVQVDEPGWLTALDRIGSNVFDAFSELWSYHRGAPDELFADGDDLLYLEDIVTHDADAATLLPTFLDRVFSVVGRAAACAITDAPDGVAGFEELSTLGFMVLTDALWVQPL
jgi:hypothetical protein